MGGKINTRKIVNGLKSVGRAFKPVAHTLISAGADIAGTAATENPILGSIIGNTVGTMGNNAYDKLVGGKFKKGSKSKTHKGDMDFTTKKGDTVYHIGKHFVRESQSPYSGGAIKKSSPWIQFVKAYSAHHKIKYSEALKDSNCKASYHKQKA